MPGLAKVMGYAFRLNEGVLLDGVASRAMTLTTHVWWHRRSWTLVVKRLDRARHAQVGSSVHRYGTAFGTNGRKDAAFSATDRRGPPNRNFDASDSGDVRERVA